MLDRLGDEEMRRRFDDIDRDDSGFIDTLELKNALKGQFEVDLSLEKVTAMVARVNLNGCITNICLRTKAPA